MTKKVISKNLYQKFLALVALSLPLADTMSYMGKSCVIVNGMLNKCWIDLTGNA
jgi:hypothetical protein